MADFPQYFENLTGAHHFRIDQQIINLIAGNYNQYTPNGVQDLVLLLNPIPDASHTRNRKKSPPDSECFPGTREEPIGEVTAWADSSMVVYPIAIGKAPHVYWLHGFAGCGKSSISLEVAKKYAGSGRLLASYFFFRGAGERSTMNRFAATLASQLMTVIPATIPFMELSVCAEPGLLSGNVSLSAQLEGLVYKPFQAVMSGRLLEETSTKGPFIIVIDGLDECEDKRGAEEFIDHMLKFFDLHPNIPLRIFVASRVEQHIRERLETDGVLLGDLNSHWPGKDIEKFLRESFRTVARRDRVIQAYIQAHGEWPKKMDMDMLLKHIGGSFVLASTIFKFIIQSATEEDVTTPMERLPLTLELNGLDTLYTQTLARSQHLPHFHDIISTITFFTQSLPIAVIADLLGIEVFEVVRVLLNLQAIIHVPGTDEKGRVTFCHTSLRDFLTTQNRSGSFFVPPSFHLRLSYCFFSYILEKGGDVGQHFERRWELFTEVEASDITNEIEQFKARHPLHTDRLPYHAFICSAFFFSLFVDNPQTPDILKCQPRSTGKEHEYAVHVAVRALNPEPSSPHNANPGF
ncbi:hypothetical protein EST38_g7353 [Candolleomyces aberdarensis]|uniref:Nephrocystin 3-like N-terminal domain-containing protein n=1 Tax=Candolleomyces aberdarensis TaxID=2316362 RepID=A0A4Q2DFU8_9AGAR|nr:hypothetical protein EST38_g7353 [Candolleomyces aberdarensis]